MPKTFLNLPHGLEVLIIKAAVDPKFKTLLLARRAEAAGEIGLTLTPTESAMLAAIPQATLEATIAQTQVLPETRRVFLGKVAAAMLAALGVGVTQGCEKEPLVRSSADILPREEAIPIKGIMPDRIPGPPVTTTTLAPTTAPQPALPGPGQTPEVEITAGIRPYREGQTEPSSQVEICLGIRPDREMRLNQTSGVEICFGIRPELETRPDPTCSKQEIVRWDGK